MSTTDERGTTDGKRPPPTPLRVPPELGDWYKRHAAGLGSTPHAEMIVALYEYAERNTAAPVPVRTPAMLARNAAEWDAEQLADLDWHWGEAYRITHPAPDVWLAQRRDTTDTMKATTPDGLFHAIHSDYWSRSVPRPGRRGTTP